MDKPAPLFEQERNTLIYLQVIAGLHSFDDVPDDPYCLPDHYVRIRRALDHSLDIQLEDIPAVHEIFNRQKENVGLIRKLEAQLFPQSGYPFGFYYDHEAAVQELLVKDQMTLTLLIERFMSTRDISALSTLTPWTQETPPADATDTYLTTLAIYEAVRQAFDTEETAYARCIEDAAKYRGALVYAAEHWMSGIRYCNRRNALVVDDTVVTAQDIFIKALIERRLALPTKLEWGLGTWQSACERGLKTLPYPVEAHDKEALWYLNLMGLFSGESDGHGGIAHYKVKSPEHNSIFEGVPNSRLYTLLKDASQPHGGATPF